MLFKICDKCRKSFEAESIIKTITLRENGQTYNIEVCDKCYDSLMIEEQTTNILLG